MATQRKTNKKETGYFFVDDERVFDIVEKLKKRKNIEVAMVTCKEIKVVWLEKEYTRADIEKMF